MHDWPIDRELDERLRQVVLDEVAAADPHQIAFRNRPARRGSLLGTGLAAAAVFVFVAALVWRSQSAPPFGGPSETPRVTATAAASASPDRSPAPSAEASPSGAPNPTSTSTPGPTLQAGLTPGPTANSACRPGKTYSCWGDGPAVPLADGRVLYAQAGAIFDPATHTFTATGRTNVDRVFGTATLLSDGRVLSAGGYDVDASRDAITDEIYDPKTGRFTPVGPVAPHTNPVSVVLADGRVLILGGDYNSPVAQLAADIFDPASGTFTAAGSAPRDGYASGGPGGRGISASLLGNGKVLVVEAGDGRTWSTEIYDPSTNTFTPSATSAHLRGATPFLAKLPDGRAMLFGGGNAAVEAYDPTTGTFGRLANMPGANVVSAFATLTDDRILALGVVGLSLLGRTGSPQTPGGLFDRLPPASARPAPDNATTAVALDGEIYDPAQDKWTDLGRLNLDRISVQVAPLPNGGAIVTGTTPGGMGAEVAELFDPKTGRFKLNQ
jgi:hypothetical protein